MISPEEVAKLAVKLQTSETNVAREYVQHVFLTLLYEDPGSDILLFKGGTALRIVYQSPRFSEDLDFTAGGSFYKIKTLIEKVSAKLKQEIDAMELTESKATTGGYFGVLRGPAAGYDVEVQIQVSSRQRPPKGELMVVTTSMAPSYNAVTLPENAFVQEKLDALLTRAKPRDFYDLYFILRKPMGDKKHIASKRASVLERLGKANPKLLYAELKEFLPKSHWAIIQGLPEQLKRELNRL